MNDLMSRVTHCHTLRQEFEETLKEIRHTIEDLITYEGRGSVPELLELAVIDPVVSEGISQAMSRVLPFVERFEINKKSFHIVLRDGDMWLPRVAKVQTVAETLVNIIEDWDQIQNTVMVTVLKRQPSKKAVNENLFTFNIRDCKPVALPNVEREYEEFFATLSAELETVS